MIILNGSDIATATGPLLLFHSAPAALRVHVQCKFFCVIGSVSYQDEMNSLIS